jgi:UbiD family decarboxylase
MGFDAMTTVSPMHDLRDFIRRLDERGQLYRFTEPINKETEMCPLFRVQQRGLPDQDRRALLFENVIGAKGERYGMPALFGAYAASEAVLLTGLGCGSYTEALDRWHEAREHPIDPVLVDRGPVHDNVLMGADLKTRGLDIFPAPVEETGFSAMLRTGMPMITRDPETGVRNVGTYNAYFNARDRMQAAIGTGAHAMFYHWQAARKRKEGLPVAIVIGCDVPTFMTGSANVPYGVDELAVAGGFMGSPIELVACRTIPLEVPAYAEAVIEGFVSTETVEPRLPFGEYPGYIHSDLTVRPILQITAITHRDGAIFTPVLVGMPPCDSSVAWGFGHSAEMHHRLKYECGFPVEEVYYPEAGGGSAFCVVRMAESATQDGVQSVLDELQKRTREARKYTVLVDYDIDPHDPDCLLWALSFCTARLRDFTFMPTQGGGLDPSASPAGSGHGRTSAVGDAPDFTRVIINATRKWAYPPVALPKRPYMEHALELWRRHADLPEPHLRQPWYGYTLGYWNDELQRYADMMVRGEYLELGREMEGRHEPIRDEMVVRNVDRGAL